MLKRLTVVALAMGFAMVLGACSDDDGGNVCEQAYSKIKKCVDGLDCTGITDTTKKAMCESMKSIYGSLSYSQAQAACEQATPGECDCTGDRKTSAEKTNSATLDPETCAPPVATPDGGTTPDQGTTGDQGTTTPDQGMTADQGMGGDM